MAKTPAVVQQSSTVPHEVKKLEYTSAERQYHTDVLNLVSNALSERERPRKEFNDMGFSEQDEYNVKLDLAYVPPAKNKNDIRLVSGLTREKTNTLVSIAKSNDFDTEFIAFDKDDQILYDLADAATDLVEKTNQLEHWRDNRGTVYRGMAARGTYFTMEVQEFISKAYKTRVDIMSLGKMNVTWNDTPRTASVEFRTIEIDPRMVVLGNLREPELTKQPFLAIGRVISEAEARGMFGGWDRFAYVPTKAGQVQYAGSEGQDLFSYYKENYKMSDVLAEGEIELLYFMRSLPFGNELSIYLNGVAMLPVQDVRFDRRTNRHVVSGFPLTTISASGEYPLVDWQYERIPGFFYSKAQPAKTKFDQDVLDFWIRFITKKAIRSINPTLGNKSGQIISNEDLQPSNIISNIRKDDLFSILPPEMIQGVTNGEFSFMEMMKKEIDEKTLSREFDGQTLNQHQTATQFMENKKAQLVKLGAMLDGIVRGEGRRAELRLRNSIIPYWFKSDKSDKKKREVKMGEVIAGVYDTHTVAKEGRDGKFNSVINITDDFGEMNGFDVLAQQEKDLKTTGKRSKITFLNPDKIDFTRTLFYVNVKPRERDNNAMQRALFDNDVITAKNMFGPDKTNDEALKVKFAQIRGDNYDTWFKEQGLDQEEALTSAMAGVGVPGAAGSIPQQGGMNPASATPPAQMALQ